MMYRQPSLQCTTAADCWVAGCRYFQAPRNPSLHVGAGKKVGANDSWPNALTEAFLSPPPCSSSAHSWDQRQPIRLARNDIKGIQSRIQAQICYDSMFHPGADCNQLGHTVRTFGGDSRPQEGLTLHRKTWITKT